MSFVKHCFTLKTVMVPEKVLQRKSAFYEFARVAANSAQSAAPQPASGGELMALANLFGSCRKLQQRPVARPAAQHGLQETSEVL